MGVTISSKNYSIDIGYHGFNSIRNRVAILTGPEIGAHYKDLNNGLLLCGDERTNFFEKYDKIISELEEKHKIPEGILNFLYASDCSGKLTYGRCKKVYEVIKDYDDNTLYGYIGRPGCAKFKDFKQIVLDCIENKCSMKWY